MEDTYDSNNIPQQTLTDEQVEYIMEHSVLSCTTSVMQDYEVEGVIYRQILAVFCLN